MSFNKPLPTIFPYEPVRFLCESYPKKHYKKPSGTSTSGYEEGKDVRAFYEQLTFTTSHTKYPSPPKNENGRPTSFVAYHGNELRGPQHNHEHSRNGIGPVRQSDEKQTISHRSTCRNRSCKEPFCKPEEGKSLGNNEIQRIGHKFLRYAQDGNVDDVEKSLSGEVCDVNFMDQYGWSALMCASYSGQSDIVKILLDNNCDITLKNNQSKTAEQLATQANHSKIARHIKQFRNIRKRKCKFDIITSAGPNYCSICELEYSSNRYNHEVSTIHQINTSDNPKDRTQYQIPETNKGFQIMLKSGWDKHHGLGSERKRGLKFPVKTELKKDRKGIGYDADGTKKIRVTHYKPNDVSAIDDVKKIKCKLKSDTQCNKSFREKQVRRNRQKEIHFRNEFNLT